MKKIISVFLAVMFFVSSFAVSSSAWGKEALPVSAGLEQLRAQFESDKAPETNGKELDYVYYSPVGTFDNEKYPIVIFLHGIGHGDYEGSQLADSGMAYWASQELQSRFSEGGAFIIMPRCPENETKYWGESFIEPLRALIDDFIEKHADNVDTTRISITGSSQGGAMVWMMLEAYPEYFASAFPIASTDSPTASRIEKCSSVAIWMIASKKDPIINYYLATTPVWKNVCVYNLNPANCRLSTFGTVYNPDGSKSSDNHHLAGVITYDLHMLDDSNFDGLTTVDGNGNEIDISAPNGLIKWISEIHSDFDGVSKSEPEETSVPKLIIEVLRNLLLKVVHFVQNLLGL